MKSTRPQRFRKKYQPLIICYKAVIVLYMIIFSATYVTTDTVAYFDHDNVRTIMIMAGTWEDEGEKEQAKNEKENVKDEVKAEAREEESEHKKEQDEEDHQEGQSSEEAIEEVVEGENDEEEKEDDEVVQ